MTKTEAQWLVNEYWPKRDVTVNQQTISMFTKAINYIKGTSSKNPDCSCQWKSQALIAKSLYEQHQVEIEKLATDGKTKNRTKKA